MTRYFGLLSLAALTMLVAIPAAAQTWAGPYVGGAIGGGMQRDDSTETVAFDTDLDGDFGDTVRTAAGADAFSPGFCPGIDHQYTTSNGVNTFSPVANAVRSESAWGYQAGGGVEARLGSRWSLTGEYLFTSLDDATDGTVWSQGPAPATNPFILVNANRTDLQRTDRFEF